MRLVLLILTVFMATTSSAQAGDRFPLLTPEQLTPEQRKLAESLIAGGRGGGAEPTPEAVAAMLKRGPFNAFMYSPELGNRLQVIRPEPTRGADWRRMFFVQAQASCIEAQAHLCVVWRQTPMLTDCSRRIPIP